jgi:hypothetical protein
MTGQPATSGLVTDLLSNRLRAPGYQQWRAQVQATGGCAAPIHLTGSTQILDRDGALLIERAGTVLAPCGNRRAAVCPACSDRYAADAYHLLRAGLAGDQSKGVPDTVTEHPRAFLTLTAPSFGPVHTRKVTRRGHVVPCRCGDRHHPADPRLATPVDPDIYDYEGAVLWQANAGALWARFTTTLRRALAATLGIGARDFSDHARLSYAKVAEYQRRGLVHFHAVIRLDGPDGPADPPPAGLTHQALRDAITTTTQAERRTWRLRHDLDQLAADTDNHGDELGSVDLDTITVVNDWQVTHIGHRDHAERELALAIAERNRTQRRSTQITRRAA